MIDLERLTIDEAIQRENKIAEENQKIVDTEIVFDDVSLSQLYCDDTEVIEEHLENYKKCAEYHKQLAEWLEELKLLRAELKSHILYDKEFAETKMFQLGYKKAIDDFVNNIKDELNCFEVKNLDTCVLFDFIDSKAEQLKAGREND